MSPAWLQAYGSILALLVALLLAFYNHIQDRKREKARQVDYMAAISAINSEAIEAVSSIIWDMHPDALHHHGITTNELDRCIQALGTITLESLPNAKAYMAIHQLRRELGSIYFVASNQHDLNLGITPDVLEDVCAADSRLQKASSGFSQALKLAK